MTDDFLALYLAERIRNFTWRPWHPHRVLSQQSEPIAQRIARLKTKHAQTRIGDVDYLARLCANLANHTLASAEHPPPPEYAAACVTLIGSLGDQNRQFIEFPDIEIRSWTSGETAYITDMLDDLEIRVTHEERIRDEFLVGAAKLVLAVTEDLLPPKDGSPFLVPLYTRDDPATLVARTLATFFSDLMPEADSIRALAFDRTRRQLLDNLLSVSKLTFEQFDKAPHRLVAPADCGLAPDAMVRAYLGGTPLADFLETPVAFAIPHKVRFEHCHVIGGTGHGKTQLLQTMALADLDDTDRPAVVVIDSQGDMVRKLSRLERFADDDRLVIVDPSDTDHPPALNVFDIHKERLDTLTLGAREQILAGIIELYDYIFGAIGADLTQKQSVVFRYITRLMLDIPGANIQTLRQLMEDERPFRPYIERLTGTTKAFFDTEFSDRSFAQTKQQIRRRLYGILSNPTFERMFSSERNRLDMATALNSGKVVLINTAKDTLKSEASSFFGRYMIALVMQAVFERAAMPEDKRRPAFLYVDEAADYFDDNIDTLLIQARKYKLGVTLAHQFLDQLAPNLRASVMTNPSIRFAGGVSRKDANALDADMRTTADFLMNMRKTGAATEFACYVRNETPAAVKITVPLGTLERAPTMSESQYAAVLALARRLVSEPDRSEKPVQASPPSLKTPPPMPPPVTTPPSSAPSPTPPHNPATPGEW